MELVHDVAATCDDDDFKTKVKGRIIDIEECIRYLQMTEAGHPGTGGAIPEGSVQEDHPVGSPFTFPDRASACRMAIMRRGEHVVNVAMIATAEWKESGAPRPDPGQVGVSTRAAAQARDPTPSARGYVPGDARATSATTRGKGTGGKRRPSAPPEKARPASAARTSWMGQGAEAAPSSKGRGEWGQEQGLETVD